MDSNDNEAKHPCKCSTLDVGDGLGDCTFKDECDGYNKQCYKENSHKMKRIYVKKKSSSSRVLTVVMNVNKEELDKVVSDFKSHDYEVMDIEEVEGEL